MHDAAPPGSVALGDPANTLAQRSPRPPDPEARSRVFARLARGLTAPPDQQVAAATIELCGAGSVGFSHPEPGAEPAEIFRWHASARPQAYRGDSVSLASATTARAGDAAVVLLDQPQRDCPELLAADPSVAEVLLAPLHVGSQCVGALWAIAHAPDGRFDGENARSLESLAHFAAAACQAREAERANGALRQSCDEEHDLLEHASVAVRWVGPDGTILWANETELDMLGYERDEYIGRKIADFHADTAAFDDIISSLQDAQTIYDHPAQLICRDGSVRDVEVSSNVFWRDGEFVHTRCFTRDVTERHKGERARARLAAIVESSDDAIISKDLDGTIASWNEGARRLFGYSAEEAIGQPITVLMPPDRRDEEPDILERIRTGGRVAHYETVRQSRDGTLLDISLTVSPIFDNSGRIIGASKIARDITERKRTERLLLRAKMESERQRRLYETTMNSTPDLVWVVDRDYRFAFINDSVLRMWGRTKDEAVGRGLREVGYEPARADQRESIFDQVVSTRQPVRGEASFPHATLGERTYDYIFTPVIDDRGEVEAIAGMSRDVTARKRAEQDLRDSQQRLTELNRSLEERVAERTERLQQQTERLRELAAELTTAEQRERRRLAAMLHDELQQLLVAAQIQLGRTRGRIEDAETAAAIADAAQLLDETMSASRNLTRQLRPPVLYEDGLLSALKGLASDIQERHLVAVTLDADGDIPALSDDLAALLFESIRELLLNVAKHAGVDAARVEVRAEAATLRLAVCDQGRGFGAEIDAMGGHRQDGFGLFSIRERLTALGGEVQAASSPGEGTRVELAVPVDWSPAELAAASSGPAPGRDRKDGEVPGRRIRVLIADDHALVRQGIAHVLGGHERIAVIAEAGDGVEALEIMHHDQPDIVLMDVNMPRMNGIEATREANRRWPDIMTVGLSVQNDDSTADLMREAGAAGFLPKTGDSGEMIAKLLALVDTPSEKA